MDPCSGLFAFASTTLVLSLYNMQARDITVPNVIVGMALFYGGLAQFLAGMWEFATGNTFGATGEYLGKLPTFSITVHPTCECTTCSLRVIHASSPYHFRPRL
jgi:hypothetical protein